jgi:dihydroneopterin aldolase
MGDCLFLEGLEVQAVIGVHAFERRAPRPLRLDLVLPCDASAAARADRLEDALDYDRIVAAVRSFAERNAFALIETFAERLAAHLLATEGLSWVRIRLYKPGAVAGAAAVGLVLERRRGPRQEGASA